MERAPANVWWKDVGLWALASALAWAAAMGIPSWMAGDHEIRQENLWLILSGLLIGAVQWLVLSKRASRSRWWILAYGSGWYVGLWSSFNFSVGLFGGIPNILWLGGAGGTIVGVLQWVTLRRHVHRSMAWVPATILSSYIGCWAGVFAGVSAYNQRNEELTAYLIGGTVAGTVMGLLSGGAFAWLTRNQNLKP